jgi:hypothetical protein
VNRCAATAVLLALALAGALGLAGCGADEGTDPFTGSWQRLAGGAPEEDFTLDIVAKGDAYTLTFANRANGQSLSVGGQVEGAELLCTLPTADGESAVAPKWAPALPQEVDVALAGDESGERLAVSMVSRDGGRLPLWEYARLAE